ncbi:hypothetical protein KKD70_00325 [Patescibacteria group bacterium]|nr:hypothetical protein [Patescibacteria group bacterium]
MVVYFALSSYAEVGRASEILLDDNVCNFASKDFSDIENMLLADTKPKIFILGDSISYGIGVASEKETISGYLRELHPEYSVYNLASCGGKSLDYYLWIQYLNDLAERVNYDVSNDIYVIQYNYKWFNIDNGDFSDRISQKRILMHFDKYIDDEISKELDFYPTFFDKFGTFLNDTIPVASNRTKLIGLFLNEKSKEDFIKHVFYGRPETNSFEYKQQYWKDKEEMANFNCKITYSSNQWNAENNFNFMIYEKTIALLDNLDKNALIYLPAYNYELTKKCQENPAFEQNIAKFLSIATSVDNITGDAMIGGVDEKNFLDDMHLNAEGNAILAQLISHKISKN